MIPTDPNLSNHKRDVEKIAQSQTVEKDTGRLEAFSDGVFSIAMTLLVLELKVPAVTSNTNAAILWDQLCHQWPSYVAFVTSFATVLIMWVNHHSIFRLIRRASNGLLFANGFLLLLVTAVPFPTALIAGYLRTPAASTACMVYAGLFVIISGSYGLLLVTARHGCKFWNEGADREIARRTKDCFLVGMPSYGLATAMALASPKMSLAICTALWIFWCFSDREKTLCRK